MTKTALKLLLVFVEYYESNTMVLLKAVNAVDCQKGSIPVKFNFSLGDALEQ